MKEKIIKKREDHHETCFYSHYCQYLCAGRLCSEGGSANATTYTRYCRETSCGGGRTAKQTKEGISDEDLAEAKGDHTDRTLEAILQDIGFDYDSYAIRQSELPKIEGIGTWMKREGETKIVAEGHCDERGTVEYNLALGQKRAEAVKNYLLKMGVEASRVRTVSFGKEMPLDPGHTEQAWAKNRRVHFKIDQKG